MLISDDGGQTSQLAITGEGIAAEAIVGTLGMFAKVRADQIVIGDDGEKIPSELLDTSYIDTQVDELDIAMSNLGNTITNAFSDGYITNIEAQSLNLARNSVVKEATDVKAIATSLQVSTTALTTAISTLNTEVNKYVGKSSYPIAVTAANRTALNNAFTALEAAIVALYAAIDQKQIAEVMDYVDIQKKDLDESIGELDDIIATAFSDNVITNIEAQSLKTAMWSILQEAGDVFSIADALGIDTDDVEETTDVLYALLTENYIDQEEYPIEVSTINREAILSAFADLETAIVALYEAIDQKRISNVSSSLTNYIDGIGTTLTGLIDSKIDTWFYEGTPTLTNNPAKDWTTNTIKDKHLDDLYYNTANGYVYRFVYESNAYKWVRIKDTDIVAAMQIASLAQDTADSKRRIFVTQPVPPYDIGDLWRVTNVSGVDFKICTATRLVGDYDANDWANVDKTKDYIDTQKQELDGAIGDLDDIISTAFSDNVITNIEAQSLKTAMWSILQEAGDVFSIADALGIDTDDVEETTDVLYALLTENYIDQEEYPIEVSTINREAILSAFADLETAIVALYEAIDQKRISNVSSSLTNYIDGIGTTLTGLIDSKIDTWFYEGTPTLTNNPAKDWTTNTIKDKHLDDLYYNTANGYVYRFVYESNAYKWVRIKDTDIVAAMQIASLAQDTADSKRRIFVTQPVPPYDIGDLWRVTNVSGVDFKICTATRLVGDYDANDWANVDKTKDYIDTQKQELDGAIGDLDDTISTAFSDGVITNIEAQGLKIARDSVVKEATDVKAIATSLQVSTTALTTAINTLNTEVNKYVGKSSYPIAVTAANRTALNNAFTNLETAIVTLYESIDIKRASDIDSTLRDDLQLASPLPGYVKLGSEGVRVYDAQNNIRGIFGSWLADAIRKYGIKIIDGEIYSTTFQTGAEDATTYIRLDPSGDFSAFCDGDRMIFMQASAYEGRIHLSTANDEYEGLRLTASFNFNQIPCGGVSGTSGGLTNRGLHLHAHGDIIMNPGGGYEVYVSGNHFVTGSKNAIMPTDSYGQRLLYSYETPESKFMDEGTAELISGFCRIDIDPIFLETIEPNTPETPFIVHLTPYDWLNLRVAEMGNSYFIVEEKDGLSGKFSWQLSATRRGYAGVRLEQVDDGEELLTSNWEDDLFEFAGQED
jgi:DNA-binding transcriptional regulator YbjK